MKKAALARVAFSFKRVAGVAACHPSKAIAQLGPNGPAGPAVAGRRERDLVGNQRILKRRDTGLVVACLALGDRCRFGGVELGGTELTPPVAQGLAVGPGVRKDARHLADAADHDLDAAGLPLAPAPSRPPQQ